MEEVHHAKEEGVIFDILTNPVEILTDEKGWVKGIKCVRMELGEPDKSGRRSPVEIKDSVCDGMRYCNNGAGYITEHPDTFNNKRT
jgi:NADPH-dependent glutamate synthase beta subunit-like oxidoreductase